MRQNMTQDAESHPALTSEMLTETEAAQQLGVSLRTLQRYRVAGTGPEWSRLGPRRIRYAKPDLAAWLRRQRVEGTKGKP